MKVAHSSPQTALELFNLRHAGARNAIERIFGVVKRKWKILPHGSEYSIDDQSRIVYAIACLYNILRTWDNQEKELHIADSLPSDTAVLQGRLDSDLDIEETRERYHRGRYAEDDPSTSSQSERSRYLMANRMWEDYQRRKEAIRRARDSQGTQYTLEEREE